MQFSSSKGQNKKCAKNECASQTHSVVECLLKQLINKSQNIVSQKKSALKVQREIPQQSIKYSDAAVRTLLQTSALKYEEGHEQLEEEFPKRQEVLLKTPLRKTLLSKISGLVGSRTDESCHQFFQQNFRRLSNVNLTEPYSKDLIKNYNESDEPSFNELKSNDLQSQRSLSIVLKKNSQRFKKGVQHKRSSTQENIQRNQISPLLPIEDCFGAQSNQLKQEYPEVPVLKKTESEIDFEIDTLRNRKIKLDAVFTKFDSDRRKEVARDLVKGASLTVAGNQNFNGSDSMKSGKNHQKKGAIIESSKQKFSHQALITDYDGEVLKTLGNEAKYGRSKLLSSRLKSNDCCQAFPKSKVFRIRTEVASNYLELESAHSPKDKARPWTIVKTGKFQPVSVKNYQDNISERGSSACSERRETNKLQASQSISRAGRDVNRSYLGAKLNDGLINETRKPSIAQLQASGLHLNKSGLKCSASQVARLELKENSANCHLFDIGSTARSKRNIQRKQKNAYK